MNSYRSLRVYLGMSQKTFAQKLGVSLCTVRRWENGTSEPSASEVRALAKMSGLSMEQTMSFRLVPMTGDNAEDAVPLKCASKAH